MMLRALRREKFIPVGYFLCRIGSAESGSHWRDSFVASSERTIAIKGANLRARKVFEEGREVMRGAEVRRHKSPSDGDDGGLAECSALPPFITYLSTRCTILM